MSLKMYFEEFNFHHSEPSYNRVEMRISKITDDNSYVLFAGAGQYNILLTL